MTPLSLLIQPPQLRHENSALPFAKTIVRAVAEMAVKPFSRETAAVVDGPHLPLKRVVVGDDDATFTGGHQLAGLKAERAPAAECSHSLSTPFTGMSVST